MRSLAIFTLPGILGAILAFGQGRPPAFEVASIKLNPERTIIQSDGKVFHVFGRSYAGAPAANLRGISGTRFREQVASVMDLIMDAYRVRLVQIAGAPKWATPDGDAFDIEAKAPGPEPLTPDRARLMLQTLLAERFRLRLHRETRELPVYELLVSKGGHKMKAVATGPDGKRPSGAVGMEQFGFVIGQYLDRPMVDKTGLTGLFLTKWDQRELDKERGADQQAHGSGVAPSVFGIVKDQLGLELKPAKDPFEILVIDSIQKPVAN